MNFIKIKALLFTVFFMFICNLLLAQIIVSGIIKSKQGETIPYAYVINKNNNAGTISNNAGYFRLNLEKGQFTIRVTHVAYAPIEISLIAQVDTFISVTLEDHEIKEIVVRSTPLARQAMIGANFLEGKTIGNIPTFFGDQDIIKAMTILPGISSGLDLFSNLYVRGGERDQNHFLMDGARFYTTSHAGGFTSLFNADIIRHIDIYKGGAPAKFGEGLSSVIDITLREGNAHPKFNIDIGSLRSGFLTEGKVGKKFNYIFAGRFSYWDILNGNFFKEQATTDNISIERAYNRFSFWDIDGKITYQIAPKTSINVNTHIGEDENSAFERKPNIDPLFGKITKSESGGVYITNNNITVGIKHITNSGISIKNTAWFTHYQLDSKTDTKWYVTDGSVVHDYGTKQTYIKDYSGKLELSFPIGTNHKFDFGSQFSNLSTTPERIELHSEYEKTDTIYGVDENEAQDISLFFEDDIRLAESVYFRAGIRGTMLKSNDTVFYSFQPRTTLRWSLNEHTTLKTGFSITQQPFHVLVNTKGYYQEESWLLANNNYFPQKALQYSGGVSGLIKGTSIEYSFEAYYKRMHNLLFYAPPNSDVDGMMAFIKNKGEGVSYGTEILFLKGSGRIQWSVAYTLAWSLRKFEQLNNGDWFPATFDHRHDLNIGVHYFKNEKNTWNFNYLVKTGRPYTLPVAYLAGTELFGSYYVSGGVNNARTPMYRRFDVSYKRKSSLFGLRKSELTLSVMNLFARHNPFAVYAKNDKMYLSTWYLILPSAQLKIYLFD